MEAKTIATKGSEFVKKQQYFVEDTNKEFHTKYGKIKPEDMKKTDGSRIKSSTDREYFVFSPKFIDFYRRIRRHAQVIPLKDIGHIIAITGIGKDSVVLEAGSGSGGFSCFVSGLVKKIISYDIDEESIATIKENIKKLKIKNIEIKKINIYENMEDKGDLFLLDVPEPWRAIENAGKSLKPGGFLVIYTPSVSQMQKAMNKAREFEGLMPVKTVELVEREWKVSGEIVRPVSRTNIHSGFISFIRKISRNQNEHKKRNTHYGNR